MKRLEEAARTESDFLVIVDEWNKLDRNREAPGSVTMKTCAGMFHWSFRLCLIRRLLPSG